MTDGDHRSSTPSSSRAGFLSRSTAGKRDLLAAELEHDPQVASAKRAHRTQTQVFTSSVAHASLERQIVALKTAKIELETKLRERDSTIERLERDRRWLADREKAEREEKERERAECENEKAKFAADLRTLRTSLSALQAEHEDLEERHSALKRSSESTIGTQGRQLTALQHRTVSLEDELSEARTMLNERIAALAEVQAQLEELGEAHGEQRGKAGVDDDMALVQEELHRQTAYMRQLEGENARLRGEVGRLKERGASIAVLQEEKRALETRLGAMDGLRERVVKLEAELARSQSQAAAAAAAAPPPSQATPHTPPPIAQTQALASLRLAHAQLLSEHGATQAALRALEARLPDLDAAQARISALESERGVLEQRAQRAGERVRLAEGEVTGLKALLASYAAEARAARDVTPDPATATAADVHREAEVQAQRVVQLEGLLGQYKAANEQLAAELDALGADARALLASGAEGTGKGKGMGRTREALMEEVARAKERVREVEEQLKAAETQTAAHLEQIDNLEQTLFELKGEMAGGRHVPPGVRVLEMRDNPARAWVDLREAAMERLRSENEALMKRLREVEAVAPGPREGQAMEEGREELVPRASWELVNREKMELEEVVKQKEKRLLRLKQVYNAKGAEFRDAIASILGVKLVFVPNGQVRVTSVYDLCASFVFQPAPQNGQQMRMQLVAQGDGGPQDLPEMMRFWIEKEQCLPGFMASVTLECYENAKREGRVP
ncbi:putative mitotic checkpoint protein [Lyophyllum shimeji]|uniref:Spindle assembly checkpoint component MAD1 n=1 Tax=Lyophyllum shimeji TaxID=47721 RepID=A0A9P3PWV1_LYOSH|nr:putative mitotic checkpoint protein [Lyophyllum shimeji]